MGHDCGGQYYPKEALKMLHIKACSILMGCSSAQHTTVGEFEPYGTILSYIIGGCPAIVANLWSVTNLCIIHFIDEFLNHCNSKEEKTIDNVKDHNICDYLSKARLACKLSHLEGSVPVIFGLPSIKETSEH
jgi:separase